MKKIVTWLLIFASVLGLTSCNMNKNPKTERVIGYFSTAFTVTDHSGLRNKKFAALVDEVREELAYYDKLFDSEKEQDGMVNIATLNANAGMGTLEVSGDMIDFLGYCKEMYYLTDGIINITAGRLISIWNEYQSRGGESNHTEDEIITIESGLAEAKNHMNIDDLVIDEESRRVQILDKEMVLDVSAIAKGYVLERVTEELRDEGYDKVVLDVEGSLTAIGEKGDGSAFEVGIRNPDTKAKDPYIYRLEIRNTACAGAEAYGKNYEISGKINYQFFDMETFEVADNFSSVTVVAPDAALATALSHALFVMNFDEGKALLETLDGIRAVWVYTDGKVVDSLNFDN